MDYIILFKYGVELYFILVGIILYLIFTKKHDYINLYCLKSKRRVYLIIAEKKLEKTGKSVLTPETRKKDLNLELEPEPEP